MKLQTKHNGEIEIDSRRVLTFELGLPAFENETSFVLLPFSNDEVFFILQSANTPTLAFVIANPFHFFPDYQVKLPDAVMEQLDIEKEEDVGIFAMLTLQEPFKKTTANLQAPIILNLKAQKGKQPVLNESGYERKHYLFPQKDEASEQKEEA
ncbi:flagellar assembly protein FliW [Alteribacillus sp. HJP-4]|uniref:flagellar assembly protein FliW n=1 Tax=Alteribacillus sp. HJP-4 TaxID=2775394 RepID=UPI0035CD3A75